MPEFSIQSDGVDVVRIMEQVRDRIKEKHGEDYTEQQIRELANVNRGAMEADHRRTDLFKRRRQLMEQGTAFLAGSGGTENGPSNGQSKDGSDQTLPGDDSQARFGQCRLP